MTDSSLVFRLFGRDISLGRTLRGAGDDADKLDARLRAVGSRSASIAPSLRTAATHAGQLTVTLLRLSATAGAMGAAANAAGGLVAALAPAAGILAALPAGAALGAGALATLKVAVAGTGDAFKAAMAADPKAFAESLKGLAPAAQSVARELHALQPELDGIKIAAQQALFAPLQGGLTQLIATLGGPLKTGMSGVAGEMGRLASGVVAFGRSTSAVTLVTGVFSSLRTEIGSIKTGTIEHLLQALGRFASSALPAFKGLGGGIDDALKGLTRWLDAAAGAGKPMQWIKDAGVIFRALGGVLADVGGIIKSIFSAMQSSGSGALGVVGQLLHQVNAFLKSAEGQQALVSIFQALGAIGKALAPVLTAVAGAVGKIAPQIADIAVALGPALAGAVTALGPALAALGPGLTAVATQLSKAFADPAVSHALVALGTAFGQILTALSPLLPVVTQVAAVLAGNLAAAVLAIAPQLPPMVTAFGQLLISLTPLIPSIVQLALALTPLIPVATDMIKLLTQLANAVMPILTTAIAANATATRLLGQVVAAVWGSIKLFVAQRVAEIASVIDWFKGLPGKIGGWFGAAKDAAVEKWNSLLTWVKGIPGKIVGALGDLASMLVKVGRDAISGLIRGIKSKAGEVNSVMVDLMRGNVIGAAKTVLDSNSPSRVFEQLGKWTVEGFIKGISGSQDKARAAVSNLVNLVKEAFKARPDTPDFLIDWVRHNTTQLSELADQREKLIKRIADAKAYAVQIAGSIAEFAKLTNIDMSGDKANVGTLIVGLSGKLSAIKQFARDIKILVSKGLNKNILRQLIEMGPEKGLSLAEMLVGASGSEIKAINRAQSQIDKVAKQLGKSAADALYDTGKKAGEGFLRGLQGQLDNLESMMAKIAKAVVDAVKKELKVKSPSLVMREIGAFTGQGLVLGLRSQLAPTAAAAGDLAAMAIPTPGAGSASYGAYGAGAAAAAVTIINNYFTVNVPPTADKASIGRALNECLGEFKRTGGKLVTP